MKDASFEPASTRSKAITGILAVVVLAGSIALAMYMVKNKPKAGRRPPVALTPVVEVQALSRTNQMLELTAMGVVVPSRQVNLQAEVSGNIRSVHPNLEPGGMVRKGEMLVQLDARSYETILSQRRATLAMAESEEQLEGGQQVIAQGDLVFMEDMLTDAELNRSLALREPQRKAAKAKVKSAQAALDEAALNVSRTSIKAPWDAVVLDAHAEVGGQAAPGSILAQLAGTETYWIEVALPVDQLRWVRFPGESDIGASSVTVLLENGESCTGRVIRYLPDLDTASRMARIIIAVDEPMNLEKHELSRPLLLNDYVSVKIRGDELQDVYSIPRVALRDGSRIWLMETEQTLHIQPVKVLWGDKTRVVIADSIGDGQKLIVSALAAPVEGMKLRTTSQAQIRSTTDDESQMLEVQRAE